MSRWLDGFNDKEIDNVIINLKNELDSETFTNVTDLGIIEEISRANLVVEFIENYIKSLNPNLSSPEVGKDIINNLNQSLNHAKSNTTNFMAKVQNINNSLTNVLNILFTKTYIQINQVDTASLPKLISAYESNIKESLQKLDFETYKSQMFEFHQAYDLVCVDSENIDSLSTQIKNEKEKIFNQAQDIQEKYDHICQNLDDRESLYSQVVKYKNQVLQDSENTSKKLTEISQKLEDLERFYIKIFGNLEGDKRIGGLKQELEERFQELDEFDKKQKEQIEIWKKEIEHLLKDATNASLASSYHKSKESYKCPIVAWNTTFILSILTILAVATWGFIEIGDKINDPLIILGAIFVRLPFYVPLSWLAIFATNRRNEMKRLQEEYKHKETLAKAYSGYKEQIEKIGNEKSRELATQLMQNLVDMTNENPNKVLDKIKKENTPSTEFLQQIANLPQEGKDLISTLLHFAKEKK